jgi:glycosyltransferase involved in cell wall biosynthesis
VPPLSVVMPVHNALPYLDQAVESILEQSFTDFEFVILDDGSTDGSSTRLRDWAARDSRIRLVAADQRLGPVGSSNRVAQAARAPVVARMDADDISYPDRLAEELELLRSDDEIGLVASLADVIDASDRELRGPEVWRLLRRSVFVPFAHGAMMYRRELFDRLGGYRSECVYWEDQDLITRMAEIAKVMVIPRALYRVRQSSTSTRFGAEQDRIEESLDRMYRCIARIEEGRGYDDLLSHSTGDKLDPRVFLSHGSVLLWAGIRPRIFRRFLKRAKLSFDAKTAATAVWMAWASVSPASLRRFLLFLLAARNSAASGKIPTDRPLLWHPMRVIGRLRKRHPQQDDSIGRVSESARK